MKLVHHVLVYVLALLQRETVATVKTEGEDHADPKFTKIAIPDRLIRANDPENWQDYANGNDHWMVWEDEIRTQIQFHNRHEIYKGKQIVLLIYKYSPYAYPTDKKTYFNRMKAAAEFARHNVRNGIVLALLNYVVHNEYIKMMDPMTQEIFAKNGAYLYFEMENKIQIFDVVNKEDLEKRHDTYSGKYIFTIYYEKDDDVRIGEYRQFLMGLTEDDQVVEYQQFQWGPLREYVSFWHVFTGSQYIELVFLKVQKESVLKGDTEFFQKICKGKEEPMKYPVVYLEYDRKVHSITYLEEDWEQGPQLGEDCTEKESNDPLQKP
ncbi:uncharacterized protein LOC128996054 isoform X1 [Macrosteles quadrilineatus]|uniref:uncharacterized protein LOC128996054 isoform X1 n=1 Tax=Macrosteles quadrilineatus TaxID=74068 RepID=UPI0023E2116A|nr:uncharacterized protein LOC128996054 isoform X1 [Macrosteles quadrilineatus]